MSVIQSITSSLSHRLLPGISNKANSATNVSTSTKSTFAQALTSAVVQTPALATAPKNNFTQDEYRAIRGAWNLAKDSKDPAVLKHFTDQMTQYGVSAADISLATNTGTIQIADFLQNRAGMPVGFGGVNASGYVGGPDKPAPTSYSDYYALNTAPITDPTQNWLRGSYQPLNEPEWSAQQVRIQEEKARGVA